MAKTKQPADANLPKTFQDFIARFPAIEAAHAAMGRAVDVAGPLDARTRCLIKIGICAGAGLETATKSHVRKALAAGATAEEIEQAVLLAATTVGFPAAVAAWQWARMVLAPEER